MVTAIKVFVPTASSDNGAASSSGGVGNNKRQLLNFNSDQDIKNNHPTVKYNVEPSNNLLCVSSSSVESPNESSNGGETTIVSATSANHPNSSERYKSYAEIEAMCSVDNSITAAAGGTPNNSVLMPYSKVIATTASDYYKSATAKRPRLGGNQVSKLHQHPAKSTTMKLFSPKTGQQKQKVKQQKGTSTTLKTTPKGDAVPKQLKQKSSAMFETALSALTQETTNDDDTAGEQRSTYTDQPPRHRGVTMRKSGKWQVQYYYHGKTRYIGVFESKTIAYAAYETTREILGKLAKGLTDEEVDSNLKFKLAKNAVFEAVSNARGVS